MGGRRALALCPDAVVVPCRFEAYSEASRAVFDIFRDTTPLVEGLSIDEAFLDVRGMRRIAGTPREMAVRLRQRVLDEVGLPITVGIATTKHLAKVASAVAKPDGLLEVPAGHELAFLHPLPVERVWGVGPVTAGRLNAHGVTTVAEAARLTENQLVSLIGRAAGRQLHALANNRDPRRVRVGVRRRSIGAQCAIGWRPKSWSAVDATLVGLVDRLGRRLRKGGRVGRTVILRLRFDDFSRATRSHTLPEPTGETQTILATARALLAAATPLIEAKGLTLVGITLSNLEHYDDQLLLPVERRRAGALDAALDAVRERFGSDAIVRAVLLGRDRGIEVPLLPDLE
jgi:DNA polymerase-4